MLPATMKQKRMFLRCGFSPISSTRRVLTQNSNNRHCRLGVDSRSFSSGRRWSGLAAINISVHGKIVVGFQTGQTRWTLASAQKINRYRHTTRKISVKIKTEGGRGNLRVFHEVIDAAGERYVDGPSARGVLVAVLGRSCNVLGGRSDISLEKKLKN